MDYREQRVHEREMEKAAFQLDRESFHAFARYQTLQLCIAGGLAFLLAIASVVLIALGESVLGLVLVITEIAALVGVFLGRQVLRRKAAGPPTDSDDPEAEEPPWPEGEPS